MSGHHPFQRLVKHFSEERKLEIERKKQELLVAIELRESIAATSANRLDIVNSTIHSD